MKLTEKCPKLAQAMANRLVLWLTVLQTPSYACILFMEDYPSTSIVAACRFRRLSVTLLMGQEMIREPREVDKHLSLFLSLGY